MPCAAAAAVTSGSLAAPSSIEYSVWTWRCANESDELLTGGGTPQWSCVPGREGAPAGDRRGRPVCEAPREGARDTPILALLEVYSEGLTDRVAHRRTDRSHPSREGASEP